MLRCDQSIVSALLIAAAVAGCGGSSDDAATGDKPSVVVTYSAVASVVGDLVGDAANVRVLVPNGTDPHDFEPSVKDVESMSASKMIVSNGLDLEEGLGDALAEAESSGIAVFHISDHVTLREGDPHVWLDPMTLAEAVPTLAQQLGAAIGVDLAARAGDVVASLKTLDAELAAKIAGVESCVLIAGHDSLGYFGARYGCEVLGSVVPSFSTAAEATAKNLAELKALAKAEGVKAIFTELGTPADVAEQLADEVGVEVVEIATHLVPDGGGYDEMMRALVEAIVLGLS